MPRKYKEPLSDLVVKAEDCYDPADYVMVRKDYLLKVTALPAEILAVLRTANPDSAKVGQIAAILDDATA